MTDCLGMSVDDGLVAISDTLVTSGRECITLKKVTVYETPGGPLFIMTSGLRSVRDKTLTYFEEALAERTEPFSRLFKAVNMFSEKLRMVAKEDRESIEAGGLNWNIHALIGGQMENDASHKLYMVYSEGNWVDTGVATPYQSIGATGYGKPIMDRALKHSDPMRHAFKVGCLSFDSTRLSAADVYFPIDVVLYRKGSFKMVYHRLQQEDLAELSGFWQDQLRSAMGKIPDEWADQAFDKLDETNSP
ncbi:MAG: peptidase [Acidobacteria bacterium]|nr:peptidase [Acidobacteriota bacterium]